MKKTHLLLISGIAIIFIILLGVYNFLHNNSFWDASFSTCISLLIAILLSFYFAQRQNDQRKQKELFVALLESFKQIVEDDKSFNFENLSRESILMRKRDINNKLSLVKEYSEKFRIEKQVSFIEKELESYMDIIGNHIDDLDTLIKIKEEIKRPLNLVGHKIFEIMISIYN